MSLWNEDIDTSVLCDVSFRLDVAAKRRLRDGVK